MGGKARLDDVYVYTVDELGKIVQTGTETRLAAVAQAEVIIESRVRDFESWLRDVDTVRWDQCAPQIAPRPAKAKPHVPEQSRGVNV